MRVLVTFSIFENSAATLPFVDDLAMLVIGWALGILSSPITDAIRRRSVKERITRAIRTELRSLQDSFATVVIQVSRRRGDLTHSLLDALMGTLMSSGQLPGGSKSLKLIDDLIDSGANLRTLTRAREAAGDWAYLSVKVQGVPFLESHLHRLDFYSHETQRQLLEIHAGCEIFNQFADEAMRYHLMLFGEGIDQERRSALQCNIEKCYERAGEKASELVTLIAFVLRSAEMRARGKEGEDR